MLRSLWILALLCAPLFAQSEPIPDDPEERLEALTRSVKDYVITTDKAAKLEAHEKPLLRFNNTVGGVVDGVVMMWTDGGRPAVLGQVFVIKSGYWLHEFQSTAASPLVLKRKVDESIPWQPREAGVSFQPVPNAPPPAATRVLRLTQMKELARRFKATEDFRVRAGDKETTQYELRVLPNAVYRYPEKTAVEDGAVFAFVHGTDPEVVLLLEATDDKWQFACAPLTCWAVQMNYDDKPVWSVEEQLQKSTKDTPYHIWGFKP
jgi:hypothetical protein